MQGIIYTLAKGRERKGEMGDKENFTNPREGRKGETNK